MFLNKTYYQLLYERYQAIEAIAHNLTENHSILSLKLILDSSRKGLPIWMNFQDNKDKVIKILERLYIEFANEIYCNHYDLPTSYEIGEKLKRIKDNEYYEIIRCINNKYTIRQIRRKNQRNIFSAVRSDLTYDKLSKEYLKISSGISETTIKNYFKFFESINNKMNEFPQTHFEKKVVFIARKLFWDELDVKNMIPSTYLPNPREEDDHHEVRSIPALPDCIVYVTPKYEVCYQDILRKNKKVHTLIVCDIEEDRLDQILNDRVRFGFNLIVVTNKKTPMKRNQLHCWNWFKEEVEIINSL